MSYGIWIKQDNGQIIDGTIGGLVFYDVIIISADTTGSITFPELEGLTLAIGKMTVSASAFGLHDISVSYSGGIPTISYAPSGGPTPHSSTKLLIFAK